MTQHFYRERIAQLHGLKLKRFMEMLVQSEMTCERVGRKSLIFPMTLKIVGWYVIQITDFTKEIW